jgi:hypothetical protein
MSSPPRSLCFDVIIIFSLFYYYFIFLLLFGFNKSTCRARFLFHMTISHLGFFTVGINTCAQRIVTLINAYCYNISSWVTHRDGLKRSIWRQLSYEEYLGVGDAPTGICG